MRVFARVAARFTRNIDHGKTARFMLHTRLVSVFPSRATKTTANVRAEGKADRHERDFDKILEENSLLRSAR